MPRAQWLRAWVTENHLPCTGRHIAQVCAAPPRTYTNDELADLLSVSFADRQRLKLWSFGAYDVAKADRKRLAGDLKRTKDKQRAADRRRAQGAKPRAQSLSQLRPWDALRISRKTWERQRAVANS
jgi:hypothetical protein